MCSLSQDFANYSVFSFAASKELYLPAFELRLRSLLPVRLWKSLR